MLLVAICLNASTFTQDEWRKFTSPTCPGPRSAHAVVASPASGGMLFLFGEKFALHFQNSVYSPLSFLQAASFLLSTRLLFTITGIFGLSPSLLIPGSDSTPKSGLRHARDIVWRCGDILLYSLAGSLIQGSAVSLSLSSGNQVQMTD